MMPSTRSSNSTPTIITAPTMATDTDTMDLKDWMKRIDGRLDGIGTILTSLKLTSEENTKEITRIDTEVKTLEGRVFQNEIDVDNAKHTLHTTTGEVKNLQDQVCTLTERVNELEQYSKRENLVISGMRFLVPYSVAAQDHSNNVSTENAVPEENAKLSPRDRSMMAQNFATFASQKLGVSTQASDIIDIHILPKNGRRSFANRTRETTNTMTIVRFNNRRIRDEIYAARMQLKRSGNRIFINEHLTKVNADIFRNAREAKFGKKIKDTWTKYGQVFVRTWDDKITAVKSSEQLTQIKK